MNLAFMAEDYLAHMIHDLDQIGARKTARGSAG